MNQKPLELMERIIHATTDPGDVVWEPFGGLGTASVAAVAMGRRAYLAEIDPFFASLAAERLLVAANTSDPDEEVTRLACDEPVRELRHG